MSCSPSLSVRFALEGAKRRLARPVQPKEPLSVTLYRRLLRILSQAPRFPILVFLFALLAVFAGLFSIDEIRNLALSDVSLFCDHKSVNVPQRENDHHRVTCPVAVTERLIKLLPKSSSLFPLVNRIVKS